jgi:predicted GIY-YIG superfamily endonuclease
MAYYVYLLASKKHGTLYLGVTNDIVRRGYEHRTKVIQGFTARYGVDKLVWFEIYDDVTTAIARKRTQEMAARLEGSLDRRKESGVGGSLSGDIKLTTVVMDSGLAPTGAPRNDEGISPKRHSGGDATRRTRNPYSRSWLWIPGSRQEARPGMTNDKLRGPAQTKNPGIAAGVLHC